MPGTITEYPQGVQRVSADTPVEQIIKLLKRDGGVFVRGLVATEDVDQAYDECRERLENDMEWDGEFFPSESTGRQLSRGFGLTMNCRGNKASTWIDRHQSDIHHDSTNESRLPGNMRPFPDYTKLVLVGQQS